jgi:hypothetical protein
MEDVRLDKLLLLTIVHILLVMLFIAAPLGLVGFLTKSIFHYDSMPVVFIVAGLLLFSLPGLFHPDAARRQSFSPWAYRCYQLIEDEDPKTPDKISLAKFQMLFWTVILATSFTWLLLKEGQAPNIPNKWLILMGISNGTYVLAKWAKTRAQPAPGKTKSNNEKN